jgi:hypothetical protein
MGEYIPEEWQMFYMTRIHKNVPQRNPKNYRGVTVICTIGSIYSEVIELNRKRN